MKLFRAEECGTIQPRPAPIRLAVCPNCRATQIAPAEDEANCPWCGNVWKWRELHLVHGRAS